MEVALLEWGDEGRVRMVGRSGDPQLISLVRQRLAEQISGDDERQPLTLVRGGEQPAEEDVERTP